MGWRACSRIVRVAHEFLFENKLGLVHSVHLNGGINQANDQHPHCVNVDGIHANRQHANSGYHGAGGAWVNEDVINKFHAIGLGQGVADVFQFLLAAESKARRIGVLDECDQFRAEFLGERIETRVFIENLRGLSDYLALLK